MKRRGWFLIAALFLAALNLRPAIASISPVIGQIQDDLGLSRAVAGLLVTFPVLGMAFFAPLASGLGARIGREMMVLGALALIGISTGARFLGGVAPMFATAILVGVGIATAQTLLPEVVKESFPARAALVTGIYTAGVNLGATIAASATVLLTESFGGFWQGALAFWGLLAIVAATVWVSPARRASSDSGGEGSGFPVRSPRTWLVVGIFSVTALMYFSAITWLAPLYRDVGFSDARAGLLLSVFTGIQVFSSLLIPAIANRFRDRRPWLALAICSTGAGMLLVALVPQAFPGAPWLWVSIMGFGQGALFPLSLTLPLDNAVSARTAGRLTALAFLVGYTLAASGPAVIGGMRDLTGGFTVPFLVLAAIAGAQLVATTRLTPGVTVDRERG